MKPKAAKDFVSDLIGDLLADDGESVPEVKSEGAPTTRSEVARAAKAPPDDATLRLPPAETRTGPEKIVTRVGASVVQIAAETSLVQSENLRVAQRRIFELESEVDRLRQENEQLAAAGETLRQKSNELQAENETLTRKSDELKEQLKSEKEILESAVQGKDREAKNLKMKVEEYEMRLSASLQKVRLRERELENRLELLKMESTALVRSKDDAILDLKRQIDQLNIELENYRHKGQDLNRQINEKQDMLKRTVKALRLALTMLEGGQDDNVEPLKKAK